MKTDRVPEDLRDKWASRRETAQALAVSIAKVDKLIKQRRLKSKKYMTGAVFVLRDSIKALLAVYA